MNRVLALLDRVLESPTQTGVDRLCAEALLRAGADGKGTAIVDRWLATARSGPSPEGVYVLCSFAEVFARLGRVERAIPLVEEAARMPRVLDPARTAERHLDLASAYAAVRRPADARLQLDLSRDEQLLAALDSEARVDHLVRVAASLREDVLDAGAAREVFLRAAALERAVDLHDAYRAFVFARTAAELGFAEEVERRLSRLAADRVGPVLGALVAADPARLDRAREIVDAGADTLRTGRLISLAAGVAPKHASTARVLLDEALSRVKDEPAERRWEPLAHASDVLVGDLADFAGALRLARESLDAFETLPASDPEWSSRAGVVAGALVSAGDLERGLALAERRLDASRGSATLVGVAILCRDAAEVLAGGPRVRPRSP